MPTLEQLANPALLSLAAKKAYRFLDRHSWYFDRADAASFSGRLAFNVSRLSEEIRSGQYSPSGKLAFAAPKRIETLDDDRRKYVVRPLCVYPFRDQVVETALVCLFADQFEGQWGDPRQPMFPKVAAFGNRLHRTGERKEISFSVGSSRFYRDWSDDYSAFVRQTESAFNNTLTNLEDGQRVVLLCCDVACLDPGVRREKLVELIQPYCDLGLSELVTRIFGHYSIETSAGLSAKIAKNWRLAACLKGQFTRASGQMFILLSSTNG
jgi:hypothetical protein